MLIQYKYIRKGKQVVNLAHTLRATGYGNVQVKYIYYNKKLLFAVAKLSVFNDDIKNALSGHCATELTDDYINNSIRPLIREEINKKTNRLIEEHIFEYSGLTFRCSPQDQFNYKTELDIIKVYPHHIKAQGDKYLTVNNKAEHELFFNTGFAEIYNILVRGRQIKAYLVDMTHEQLLTYKDPR
jgi:hypothetical protein